MKFAKLLSQVPCSLLLSLSHLCLSVSLFKESTTKAFFPWLHHRPFHRVGGQFLQSETLWSKKERFWGWIFSLQCPQSEISLSNWVFALDFNSNCRYLFSHSDFTQKKNPQKSRNSSFFFLRDFLVSSENCWNIWVGFWVWLNVFNFVNFRLVAGPGFGAWECLFMF